MSKIPKLPKAPPLCTVEELILTLQGYVQEVPAAAKYPVIMSKDGEGNEFSPFSQLSPGNYEPISAWSGEIVEKGGVPVVVLWPRN